MKLGHGFYPLISLKSNQKYGVFLKKPQNSGKFARIFIPHSNGPLSPIHNGYIPLWPLALYLLMKGRIVQPHFRALMYLL